MATNGDGDAIASRSTSRGALNGKLRAIVIDPTGDGARSLTQRRSR